MIVTLNREDIEYMKKVWWNYPKSIRFVISFSVLTAVTFTEALASVLYFMATRKDAWMLIASVLIFCFCLLGLLRICLMPHRMLKKLNAISPDVVETLYFSENGFAADNNGTGLKEHVEYGYDRVTKAFYSDNWFVICCDANRVYPIRCNSFKQGEPRQLAALLRAKLGTRFKG